MSHQRARQRPNKSEKIGDDITDMPTDVQEKLEINIDFPKTIHDRTFQTPEELTEYVKDLDSLIKDLKPIAKAIKPGRPTSQKKAISTAVSDYLNSNMSDELRSAVAKLGDEFVMRLVVKDGVFSLPVSAPRAEGSGGNRGGRMLTVDGVEFTSAKSARDSLHPDMKDKNQNYNAIVKYLEGKDHTVVVDTA